MNKDHHIYELSEAEIAALNGERHDEAGDGFDDEQIAKLREDVARLDGYLKGRADSDGAKFNEGLREGVKRGKGANKDLVG